MAANGATARDQGGLYWWLSGTQHTQWTLPEGTHRARDLQVVEQLVEVPTVLCFVEQTDDIPVQGGGGRRGELQGPVPGKGSAAPSSVNPSSVAAFNTAEAV